MTRPRRVLPLLEGVAHLGPQMLEARTFLVTTLRR